MIQPHNEYEEEYMKRDFLKKLKYSYVCFNFHPFEWRFGRVPCFCGVNFDFGPVTFGYGF